MISVGKDRKLYAWDARYGLALQDVTSKHEGEILSVVHNPVKMQLATTSVDGLVYTWTPGNFVEVLHTINKKNVMKKAGMHIKGKFGHLGLRIKSAVDSVSGLAKVGNKRCNIS